jgi:hypothetical protein
MSREVGDWLNTGHQAGLAIGANTSTRNSAARPTPNSLQR